MAYSTSDLNTIVSTLEASLATGAAEVQFEGRRIKYNSVSDIRKAITYFQSLLPAATDAPANPTPKIRTIFLYGGKGIGI